MESVPYGPERLDHLLALARENAVRRPGAVYLMPSDIAWREPAPDEVHLWYDDAGLAGYAWYEPLTGVELDLRHDLAWSGDVATAMLDWAEVRRRTLPEAYPWLVDLDSMEAWQKAVEHPIAPKPGDGRWLTVAAMESHADRVAVLEGRGYAATRHFAPDYRFDLRQPPPTPALPGGLRIRNVTEADVEARVAVHRAAWVGSSWTVERYQQLRRHPAYDEQLDLVAESADGTFAGCCIAWADARSGIGSFEPVGADPVWRGRGITSALIRAGLRRLAERGMRTARVGTTGFNAPAQALYEGCGFVRTGTMRTFMRRLD